MSEKSTKRDKIKRRDCGCGCMPPPRRAEMGAKTGSESGGPRDARSRDPKEGR